MLLPLPSTCYNMFSIEMINPNYMTHLDHAVRIIITWSEWNYRIPRNQNNRNGIRVVGNQYFYYSLNSMLSGKVKLSLKKMYSLAFLLD